MQVRPVSLIGYPFTYNLHHSLGRWNRQEVTLFFNFSRSGTRGYPRRRSTRRVHPKPHHEKKARGCLCATVLGCSGTSRNKSRRQSTSFRSSSYGSIDSKNMYRSGMHGNMEAKRVIASIMLIFRTHTTNDSQHGFPHAAVPSPKPSKTKGKPARQDCAPISRPAYTEKNATKIE